MASKNTGSQGPCRVLEGLPAAEATLKDSNSPRSGTSLSRLCNAARWPDVPTLEALAGSARRPAYTNWHTSTRLLRVHASLCQPWHRNGQASYPCLDSGSKQCSGGEWHPSVRPPVSLRLRRAVTGVLTAEHLRWGNSLSWGGPRTSCRHCWRKLSGKGNCGTGWAHVCSRMHH